MARVLLLIIASLTPILCNENLQCCATIRPSATTCLVITSTYLEWGKWTNNYNRQQETNSPVIGTVINGGGWYRFCSSGRQGSATGTVGSVSFQQCGHPDKSITISWSKPWTTLFGGSNYVIADYRQDQFSVVEGGDSDEKVYNIHGF